MSLQLWCLAALMLSACASSARAVGTRKGTEISTSVIITGLPDMEAGTTNGMSACEAAAHNSKGFNATKINYVITLNAIGEENAIHRYYYKDRWGKQVPADQASIARFKSGLERCFRAGVNSGFTTLHIVPHVDPTDFKTGRGLWRNIVKFSPLTKYGPDASTAFSYEDVLLKPVAEAVNNVVGADTAVEFTLSAEQGRSVWSYPKEYITLLDRTKAVTARNKNATRHVFGVSFNYDKVCGCVEPEEPDPILYNQTYLQRFSRFVAAGRLKKVDVEGVKQLLHKSDFIGLSSYAPLPAELSLAAMEVSIQTAAFELKPFGIDLSTYLFAKNKQLIYSEQGLGGCERNAVAQTLDYVRIHPFSGLWPSGGYTTSVDPWKVEKYRTYRRKLYQHLSQWAAVGGGPQYRIDGVFVWNVGTWDVHGVHPGSTNNAGTYGDPVIINYIRQGKAVANHRKL